MIHLCASALYALGLAAPVAAQDCAPHDGFMRAHIRGDLIRGQSVRAPAGPASLVLTPTDYGWRIEMSGPLGDPVPVFAPPMRPVETNPLRLSGWHFRNEANTGPNTGDVNAPQHIRRFTFGMLAETSAAGAEPDNSDAFVGIGALTIGDFTLSPPAPGSRAHFETMAFDACLYWRGVIRLPPLPSTEAELDRAAAHMRGCGLDTGTHTPEARYAQSVSLRPDLDGDGIPELAVPIRSAASGAPGIAICLGGTDQLIVAGYGGRIGAHFDPSYFDSADFWAVHSGPIGQGAGEAAPPHAAGDAILLGKDDSSSVLLLLGPGGALTSYWQGD